MLDLFRRTGLVGLAVVAAVGCDGPKATPESTGPFASDLPFDSVFPRGIVDHVADPFWLVTEAARDEVPNSSDALPFADGDIVQVEGDRVYSASEAGGLSIVDASDQDALRVLGRYRGLLGSPLALHLRGGVALVVSHHSVVALDIEHPREIKQLSAFDLRGSIVDTHIEGDVLYAVSFEEACPDCAQEHPATRVLALNFANPRALKKVDELEYAERPEVWKRASMFKGQRLFIAAPDYGDGGPVGSSIAVIDLSDPTGKLGLGAVIKTRGRVSNSWQMDEYDGVLRVVSHATVSPTSSPTQVQTFKLVSSNEVETLATLDLAIPALDSVSTAHFDATRAYLSTLNAPRILSVDLTDPLNPKLGAELARADFTQYMETHGDRMLGFDNVTEALQDSIVISLFDVSDLAGPKRIDRLALKGSLPRGLERLRKLVQVLPSENSLLLPFTTYSSSFPSPPCTDDRGIYLLDYTSDRLHLRSSFTSLIEPRRVWMSGEKLLAVSDQRVEAYAVRGGKDIALRSKAYHFDNVRFATQLDNDVVARLVSPDGGRRVVVELVSSKAVEDVNQRFSEVDLDALIGGPVDTCQSRRWSLTAHHADGERLYLFYAGSTPSEGPVQPPQSETGLIVIDASDPMHPQVAHQHWSQETWAPSAGYRNGEPYAWNGAVLAVLERAGAVDALGHDVASPQVRLRVIDARDAGAISVSTLPLGDDEIYSGLIVDGDHVRTSHFAKPPARGPLRVRFFADDFDISDPAEPRRLPKVNIPGVLAYYAYYDRATGHAITTDFHRKVERGTTHEDCRRRFVTNEFEQADPTTRLGTCTGYVESLNLIDLGTAAAVLEDAVSIGETQHLLSWSAKKSRFLATITASEASFQLIVLSGFERDALTVGRLTFRADPQHPERNIKYPRLVEAYGDKALLLDTDAGIVVDLKNPTAPVIERALALPAAPSSLEIRGRTALLAMGDRDVQWLDLR